MAPSKYSKKYIVRTGWFHWKNFNKNVKITNILKENNIYPEAGTIEGIFYPKSMLYNIIDAIDKLHILDNITYETVFEEILPATFEMYLYNFKALRICKVFFNKSSVTLQDINSLEDNNDNIYIVKRVKRTLNDPVRKYIRTLHPDQCNIDTR
jgi:hypothetical protein